MGLKVMIKAAAVVLLALSYLVPVASANAAAVNRANEYLQKQSPAGQASLLGKAVRLNCTGKTAFFMGMGTKAGDEALAFWSVKCANGNTYAVEVAPNGTSMSMQCSAFAANTTHPVKHAPAATCIETKTNVKLDCASTGSVEKKGTTENTTEGKGPRLGISINP